MKHTTEEKLRRKAIRLLARGMSVGQVLKRVGRSRAWLSKWRKRYRTRGLKGLRTRSSCPRHPAGQWPKGMRRLIVQTRQRLSQAPAGLVGARAIRSELKHLLPRQPLPSERTITRVLVEAGVIAQPIPTHKAYFPAPYTELIDSLDAIDWTCRYLSGGVKVYAFHTLNLRTRAVTQTLADNKAWATVYTHVLTSWKTQGIPRFLQLDNDALFCGGYKVRRVFGHLTRLCLMLGIELIFLPYAQPKHNFQVEQFNGLWGGPAFWRRHHFRHLGDVRRWSPRFIHWYMHAYTPPALHGDTPYTAQHREVRPRLTPAHLAALPDPLPITAGLVHFIRQVQPDGTIRILNEPWLIDKRRAGQYVWATLHTQHQTLDIWFRRNLKTEWKLIKHAHYEIDVPVLKRPAALSDLFTRSCHLSEIFFILKSVHEVVSPDNY